MPKQIGNKNTSPELRHAIYNMALNGFSTTVIADLYNMSTRTVRHIIAVRRDRGHSKDAPRSGQPKKLDERSTCHLKQVLDRDRRQTLGDLTKFINTAIPASVSEKTVVRAIGDGLQMFSRIARKKPFLKKAHRVNRLEWARMAKEWGVEEWRRIIWTDEASAELGKNTRVCRVWRRTNEAYDERCLAPTFKSGRTSVMVWGCIAYNKKGPLIIIPKNMRTGADYVKLVLAGPLWDVYARLYKQRGVAKVMEDGAPIHRSIAAKNFRESHLMETIPHPAQSPDMNPLEHVWKRLKDRINRRPHIARNAEELGAMLLEEWEMIDMGFINHLIDGMPERVDELLKAKGGPTRY
jgi:transposase